MEEQRLGHNAEQFMVRYGKWLLLPPKSPYRIMNVHKFLQNELHWTDWPKRNPGDPLDYLSTLRHVNTGIAEDAEFVNIEGFDLAADVFCASNGTMGSIRIEVKAAGDHAAIMFGSTESPTIPIEMIANEWIGGGQPVTTPGWFWHLTHIKESNEMRKDTADGLRAVAPHLIVFCLYEKDTETGMPYATICFVGSQFIQALTRIITERFGWDMDQWKPNLTTEEQAELYKREMRKHFWNCPLELLKLNGAKTHIIMVNDDPAMIYKGEAITSQRIKNRFNQLKTLAGGRRINTEEIDRFIEKTEEIERLAKAQNRLHPEEIEALFTDQTH